MANHQTIAFVEGEGRLADDWYKFGRSNLASLESTQVGAYWRCILEQVRLGTAV